MSRLADISTELDRIAPKFEISASQVSILDSPASFYGTLKVGYSPLQTSCCKLAKTRIGQNQQGTKTHLPFYLVHWQDGK